MSVERFEHAGASLVAELSGPQTSASHLVFLHGWGSNREALRGIAVAFQATHRVHLLDLPGFGDAPPPPGDWDTVRYADLVEQYLARHAPGELVLIGHSFGGRVVVRLAARGLPGLQGLVMIGVPGLPAPLWSRRTVRRLTIRALRTVLRTIAPVVGQGPLAWHTGRFGSRDYRAAGDMRGVFVRIVNEDLSGDASRVRCPVLLLWGADDPETPLWLATRYKTLFATATLAVLPHKGHFPFEGTGAHLCAHKIRTWMETGQ